MKSLLLFLYTSLLLATTSLSAQITYVIVGPDGISMQDCQGVQTFKNFSFACSGQTASYSFTQYGGNREAAINGYQWSITPNSGTLIENADVADVVWSSSASSVVNITLKLLINGVVHRTINHQVFLNTAPTIRSGHVNYFSDENTLLYQLSFPAYSTGTTSTESGVAFFQLVNSQYLAIVEPPYDFASGFISLTASLQATEIKITRLLTGGYCHTIAPGPAPYPCHTGTPISHTYPVTSASHLLPELEVVGAITELSGSTLSVKQAATRYPASASPSYSWFRDSEPCSDCGTGPSFTTRLPGKYHAAVAINRNQPSTGVRISRNSDTVLIKARIPLQPATSGLESYSYRVTNRILTKGVKSIAGNPSFSKDSVAQSVQYVDGIARVKQSIVSHATQKNTDAVSFVSYDGRGRVVKSHTPYVRSTSVTNGGRPVANPLTEQQNFYTTPTEGVTPNTSPHSQAVFDASPLSRVLKQDAAPAPGWKMSDGRFSTQRVYAYTTPTIWRGSHNHTNGMVTFPRMYQAGELIIHESKDAQGNRSWRWIDRMGRMIVQEALIDSATNTRARTHYVYDDFGRVVRVYQPEWAPLLNSTYDETNNNTINQNDRYTFSYRYDAKGRVYSRKQPGKGWEFLVYYPSGLIALTQDAAQAVITGYHYTYTFYTYDKLGRQVMTGEFKMPRTPSQMQAIIDSTRGNEHVSRQSTAQGQFYAYSMPNWLAHGLSERTPEIEFLFDDYDFLRNGTTFHARLDSVNVQRLPLGMSTGHRSFLADTLRGITHYDYFGRTVFVKENMYSFHDTVWAYKQWSYDFNGRLTSESIGSNLKLKVFHDGHGEGPHVQNLTYKPIADNTVVYNYNAEGRLYQIKHGVYTILRRLEYNDLGQLIEENLNGAIPLQGTIPTFAQSVDYRYHPLGMLQSINNVGGATEQGRSANSNDLFHLELGYETEGPDLATNFPAHRRRRTDGRVSWARYSDGGTVNAVSYRYDGLGRLLESHTGWQNFSSGTWGPPQDKGFFNERFSYDKNGNILTLSRRQSQNIGQAPVLFDSLAYTYTGNRLFNVHDVATATLPGDANLHSFDQTPSAANPGAAEYTYDHLGAITADINRSVTASYTRHGRTRTLTKGGVTHTYTYDGLGRKVGEVTVQNGVSYRRVFCLGAELALSPPPTEEGQSGRRTDKATYSLGGVAMLFSQLASGSSQLTWTYAITDHQGSPRAVFQVNSENQAVAIERSHYYPSGLRIAAQSSSITDQQWSEGYTDAYRVSLTLGLVMQEHGVRHYDPTLGRWQQYEPLQDQYAMLTPYQYVGNDFVNATDPTGFNIWYERAQVMHDQLGDVGFDQFMRQSGGGGGSTQGSFGNPNSTPGSGLTFINVQDMVHYLSLKGGGRLTRNEQGGFEYTPITSVRTVAHTGTPARMQTQAEFEEMLRKGGTFLIDWTDYEDLDGTTVVEAMIYTLGFEPTLASESVNPLTTYEGNLLVNTVNTSAGLTSVIPEVRGKILGIDKLSDAASRQLSRLSAGLAFVGIGVASYNLDKVISNPNSTSEQKFWAKADLGVSVIGGIAAGAALVIASPAVAIGAAIVGGGVAAYGVFRIGKDIYDHYNP